jgi:glucose-1-phosphate thymidylyltransferase
MAYSRGGITMKGLLLCGENDSKLLPITSSIPKQMLPVANIPVCEYIVRSMVQAGIRSVGIVVGDNRSIFTSHFKDGRAYNCRIRYIEQPKPLGTANALMCARDFLDDDDFLLVLGDIYFEEDFSEYMQLFKREKLDALVLSKRVDNPWQYGVISIQEKRITKIVEKPAVTISDLAAIGVYIFRHPILKACTRIKPSHEDGCYNIGDAIQYLIDREYRLSYSEITGSWYHVDTSRKLIECNKIVNCKSENKNCIAQDTQITNATVGEGITIGSRCSIKDSSIMDSVIMDDCIINGVELYDSIVCRGCDITGSGRISGVFAENTRIFVNE